MVCSHMETIELSSTWREGYIFKSLQYAKDKKQEAVRYHGYLTLELQCYRLGE